jgi:hypothetical protein
LPTFRDPDSTALQVHLLRIFVLFWQPAFRDADSGMGFIWTI